MGSLGDAYHQLYQSSQPPTYILNGDKDGWHIYTLSSDNQPRRVPGVPSYPTREAAEGAIQILLTAWRNAREQAVTNSFRKLGIAPKEQK